LIPLLLIPLLLIPLLVLLLLLIAALAVFQERKSLVEHLRNRRMDQRNRADAGDCCLGKNKQRQNERKAPFRRFSAIRTGSRAPGTNPGIHPSIRPEKMST
jgi:hypothetical protein